MDALAGKPLAGRTVVLLRARGQGGELADGLRALGAELLEVPLLAFAPPLDPSGLRAAAREPGRFDWIAFTSGNAVAAFLDAVREEGREPAEALAGVSIASVGPGTTKRLAGAGLPVALEAGDSVQEGLAAALEERGVRGRRVLLPRSDLARDALEKALAAAGALVTAVVAYRTVEGAAPVDELRRAFEAGRVAAVCFTSPSTVHQLASRVGDDELRRRLLWPGGALAATIGPIASAALREHGIEPGVEAPVHTAPGLVAAVRGALAP